MAKANHNTPKCGLKNEVFHTVIKESTDAECASSEYNSRAKDLTT